MTTMSLNGLPSAATVYGAYASISSSVMLLKTTYHQLVPSKVHDYVLSAVSSFFKKRAIVKESSLLTLIVEKYGDNQSYLNHLFSAFEIYMSTKATPITSRLKISKMSQKTNQLTTTLAQEETITDSYKGVNITWSFFCKKSGDEALNKLSWFELGFEKIHKEFVIDSYIPFVMKEVTTIQNAKRDLKLHTYTARSWSPIDLEHASTFKTLAMEPSEKKALMDDLDLFVKRRDFFKRVGRAWKRGYLLYGPPGTGKSSLVAAMANYLKFDIYDLQLSNVSSDNGLRTLLMRIANRSILVIEDIDCSVDLPDRTTQENNAKSNSCKFSLSGLLNCIDGLWSSCGDERIIIFTTNNKDKLDPALLRPGRMDMHIHMSYLTINGFKTLASTYLEITNNHWRFREIEELLGSIEVTPAEVAEELMRSCNTDVCLGGLVSFLKEKKRKRTAVESNKDGEETNPVSKDGEETTPESKDGDTTSGVEIIPKAKKIKTNDLLQDGLSLNGVVAPVNADSDPIDDENSADDYDEESKPIDDEDIEDVYSAENTSNETDDEDNETDDEDSETDDEDS